LRERNYYCSTKGASLKLQKASNGLGARNRSAVWQIVKGIKAMVTVKSSQKIFTDAEIASLTGICVDHIRNFAKRRHLGFIARAAEAAGKQADQWLFTLSDLMVLVTLFPRCTH
jgi:hypothetical protein